MKYNSKKKGTIYTDDNMGESPNSSADQKKSEAKGIPYLKPYKMKTLATESGSPGREKVEEVEDGVGNYKHRDGKIVCLFQSPPPSAMVAVTDLLCCFTGCTHIHCYSV